MKTTYLVEPYVLEKEDLYGNGPTTPGKCWCRITPLHHHFLLGGGESVSYGRSFYLRWHDMSGISEIGDEMNYAKIVEFDSWMEAVRSGKAWRDRYRLEKRAVTW